MKVIDLFAGCGGLALGFEKAGFEHVLLVDNNKNACATLKRNRPLWNVIHDSITNLDLEQSSADVLCAGLPCQPFSVAGKKLGLQDERGSIFFEFVRVLNQLKPKIFVIENVKGILFQDNGKTFELIKKTLENSGYNIAYQVLDAKYYNVPQARQRLFIIGTAMDLPSFNWEGMTKHEIIPLKDVLQNVPDSPGFNYSEYKKSILDLVPEGGWWKDLPINIMKEYMGNAYYQEGGKTGIARRLSMDKPCYTLTCNPMRKQTELCHPLETRPLTTREYARIQTFPDDYEFIGSTSSIYRQIGNAVPVNLAHFVAQLIVTYIL